MMISISVGWQMSYFGKGSCLAFQLPCPDDVILVLLTQNVVWSFITGTMMKILPHPTGKSRKQWLTITSIYSGQELCKFTNLIFINILQLHCKVDTVIILVIGGARMQTQNLWFQSPRSYQLWWLKTSCTFFSWINNLNFKKKEAWLLWKII